MDTVANRDAAIYFAKKVFPLLKKENKKLKFIIIGARSSKEVLKLRKIEGIKVTGFVKDPYEYLKASKVVVAPIRFGAGMQNKILEGMALKKQVVITSLGAQAIKGKNGEHFLVADEA